MRYQRTNALVIQTPEGISFPLLLASPVTRSLAWIIDAACIGILSSVGTLLLGLLGWINADIVAGIGILFYFVVSIGYGMVAEWYWRGQTIGKRFLKLRVIDAQGLHLQASQIIIRNLLRAVDSLPAFYFIGGTFALLGRCGQRLGDLAANTLVIRHPSSREPDLEQLLAGKYNSFRDYPHLVGRLRQYVSPEEAGIALQALLRREELEPKARVELFGEMANHFRNKVSFPAEVMEGITDEQYVRNVVDLLFRTRNKESTSKT